MDLGKLSRYYQDCLGQDTRQGVGVLARPGGQPDYVELPRLPLLEPASDWHKTPGAWYVLSMARRRSSQAWLGYPVRLRHELAAGGVERVFVEPLLLWRLEVPEHEHEGPRIGERAPLLNVPFLSAEEAARLVDESGWNAPLADLPAAAELAQRLARIRPGWDWKEALDPADCTGPVGLAELREPGVYNRAVLMAGGAPAPLAAGQALQLHALEAVPEARLQGTALARWLAGEAEPLLAQPESVPNILVDAAARGLKVLFVGMDDGAVADVQARANALAQRPLLLRLGAEHQARLASDLGQILTHDATRLSPAQREDLASYAALLQFTGEADGTGKLASVHKRLHVLHGKVLGLLDAWALTPDLAHEWLPFAPGLFDLVVIDANRCDIPTALPLLYRAKRSVIAGNPQRRASALGRARDSELQHRHGLGALPAAWTYSASSLYDLAASLAAR